MGRLIAFSLLILGVTSGCARVPCADDGSISCDVAKRIQAQVEWRQGGLQTECVESFIQECLLKELSAELAIQIALFNNPEIQAFFEEIGIAKEDLVEAGLMSNPFFELDIRYPRVKGLKTNIEYLITGSLLDVFLIPLRTKLAATEFEETKLRVSNKILDLAFNVREAFYEAVAEKQKVRYLEWIVELTSIRAEISAKQLAAGNIDVLAFQVAQSRRLEAALESAQSKANLICFNEKLIRLLGFKEDEALKLPAAWAEDVEDQTCDLEALEAFAMEERLDLKVARFEQMRLKNMLGLKEGWTYTNLQGGLAGERDPDGTNLLGPGFSGEIPLFNYGQAARRRLMAEWRRAGDDLAALKIHVRSQVREAYKLLKSQLAIINQYKNELLPMHEKISASSEELYNVMGLGIDTLLENKQQEVITLKNYSQEVKKYWLYRLMLDRALGSVYE